MICLCDIAESFEVDAKAKSTVLFSYEENQGSISEEEGQMKLLARCSL